MATKGTYVAYQPLRPVELTVGDFISKKIDQYVAEGKAAEAAKLKRMQEEGKALMDFNKEIKIDAIGSIPPFQKTANKVTQDAMDTKSYAMRISENSSIPLEKRKEISRLAEKKAQNVLLLNKFIGSKEFVEGYASKMKTKPEDIFEGDKSLHLMNAITTGDVDLEFDANGELYVIFPNQNQKPDEKAQRMSFAEASSVLVSPYENDLSKDIEAFQKNQASNLYRKDTDGRGGNRTISQNIFLKEEATKTFETTFGDFDVNSQDPILKQFSYSVLGKKSIQNKEDYDKVKQAWVDKLETYVPKEYSVKDEKSAADLAEQQWRIRNAQKQYNKPDNPAGASQEIVQPILSNGDSIVQIRNSKGAVLGTQRQNVNSISLPKLKGKPATENSFGVASFKDSKGVQRDTWLMGAPAEDGKMVYSRIDEKDLNEYISRVGYNPIVVKKNLLQEKRLLNRYTSQVDKGAIYDKTKINFKSKNVEDDDSNTTNALTQY